MSEYHTHPGDEPRVNPMRGCPFLRQGLSDMLAYLPLSDFSMLEIGSYAGESADIFASSTKTRSVWCVDPWLAGFDPTDPASDTDFDAVEAAFDRVMAAHASKIHKFKGVTAEFIYKNPDFTPDFVYIDANHTYECVKDDIITVLQRWKGCGLRFLGGHDYGGDKHGVTRAVNELLGSPDKVFADSSWVFSV